MSRRVWRTYVGPNVARLVLILVAAAVIFPFYWILIGSVEPNNAVLVSPPHLWPVAVHLSNFVKAWRAAPFGIYYVNSLFVTSAIVFGQVITCALAAYALTFIRMPFKGLLFFLVLVGLMSPEQVSVVPVFLEMHDLGWINTYQALIIPFLGSAFGIFLLRQSFRSIPPSLIEAARIDGAPHWRTLVGIVVPNTRPAFITLIVLNSIFHYNDLFWPLMFTNTDNVRTLPIGLDMFFGSQEGLVPWNQMMAADVFIVIPMFLLFFFAQRYLVEGVVSTGIK